MGVEVVVGALIDGPSFRQLLGMSNRVEVAAAATMPKSAPSFLSHVPHPCDSILSETGVKVENAPENRTETETEIETGTQIETEAEPFSFRHPALDDDHGSFPVPQLQA